MNLELTHFDKSVNGGFNTGFLATAGELYWDHAVWSMNWKIPLNYKWLIILRKTRWINNGKQRRMKALMPEELLGQMAIKFIYFLNFFLDWISCTFTSHSSNWGKKPWASNRSKCNTRNQFYYISTVLDFMELSPIDVYQEINLTHLTEALFPITLYLVPCSHIAEHTLPAFILGEVYNEWEEGKGAVQPTSNPHVTCIF